MDKLYLYPKNKIMKYYTEIQELSGQKVKNVFMIIFRSNGEHPSHTVWILPFRPELIKS